MHDWDDLRFVLAVARTGSLAAAANHLRVDATTVGRRIDGVEERLGTMFVRQRGAWRTTPLGAGIVAAAEDVEQRITRAERVARAEQETPAGRVRLTTFEAVATYLIAPLVPTLATRFPAIELFVSTEPESLDLTKGEADLAVRLGARHSPPVGAPELVARRLAEITEVPYVARSWLATRALHAPAITNLEGAPIIVAPHTGQRADLAKVGGGPVVLRTVSTSTAMEAVARGGGVGILPVRLVQGDTRLVPLDGLGIRRTWTLWMVFREEVGRTPAVRAVVETLASGLAG